jgi:hypothetical protein
VPDASQHIGNEHKSISWSTAQSALMHFLAQNNPIFSCTRSNEAELTAKWYDYLIYSSLVAWTS